MKEIHRIAPVNHFAVNNDLLVYTAPTGLITLMDRDFKELYVHKTNEGLQEITFRHGCFWTNSTTRYAGYLGTRNKVEELPFFIRDTKASGDLYVMHGQKGLKQPGTEKSSGNCRNAFLYI
jgi:hypothetical protein